MPFYRLFYHVIWATKDRATWITPHIESVVFETIRRESNKMNSPIYAINGTTDHIHVAVTIPPSIAVAQWVKNIKGVATFTVNKTFPDLDNRFHWQEGYGILSFGQKRLADVVEYVHKQKEHHANSSQLIGYLEQIDE